jgi:hypothetical protein
MLALEAHPYAMEFRDATTKDWKLPSTGKTVGEVRAAHGDSKHGAGGYVFVEIHEAG